MAQIELFNCLVVWLFLKSAPSKYTASTTYNKFCIAQMPHSPIIWPAETVEAGEACLGAAVWDAGDGVWVVQVVALGVVQVVAHTPRTQQQRILTA